MTAPRPLLEVTDLVRHFAARGGPFQRPHVVRAVDGVSFMIARGETLGLVGESGSGKTTLGRCILRLLEPTAGGVRVDGVDVLSLSAGALRSFRRRMQVVFQDPAGSLNPRMRVGDAVREPIEVHRLARGAEARDRVVRLFTEVGLDPGFVERYPHELSGGQKQRVGIARALSVEPELLVLDEPVSALDVSVQAQVLNLLADLRDRHALTYLFIAHDLAVVRHLADRVAVMYLGRLIEVADAAALYADARHPYTRALLSAAMVPDPGARRDRIVLRGDPPAGRAARGCPFQPRCFHPRRDARCESETPLLRDFAAGHQVACHYAEQTP